MRILRQSAILCTYAVCAFFSGFALLYWTLLIPFDPVGRSISPPSPAIFRLSHSFIQFDHIQVWQAHTLLDAQRCCSMCPRHLEDERRF